MFVTRSLAYGTAATIFALSGTAQAQAPAADPSTLTRSAFIATMDLEFRKRDTDGDGRATRAELEVYERNASQAAASAQNLQLFRQLDVNRDGQISQGEFTALIPQVGMPDVGPMMTRFDTNRDQAVTLIEYRAATLANFDKLDTDHDGTVTQAEMRAGGVDPGGR